MIDKQNNFKINIKYKPKLRRVSLKVLANRTVQITAPRGVNLDLVYNFIESKQDWILKRFNTIEDIPRTEQLNYKSGDKLTLLGQDLVLNISVGPTEIYQNQNQIYMFVGQDEVDNTGLIKAKLIHWYQKIALEHLKDRVEYFSSQLGIIPKTFTLKSYRSRWGACTNQREIFFNWQIITFKPRHIDYVVTHELCHLLEMNHSPKFYAHLKKLGFDKKQIHSEMRYLKNLF